MIERRAIAVVIRVALGTVLLLAALGKLIAIESSAKGPVVGIHAFAARLQAHGVVTQPSTMAVAVGVITTEFILGSWLFLHRRARLACLAFAALMVVFTSYLGLAWWRSGEADCGCFGTLTPGRAAGSILRNAALAGAAMVAWSLSPRPGTIRDTDRLCS